MATLTLRNKGLIADSDQRRLSEATILIAGCGSTGGAAVEPLVRAGALRLLLAEPDGYELSNLNRQRGSMEALGCNKAEWLARQAKAINPYLTLEVFDQGITAENAQLLCRRSSIVVDAVDVTSQAGLSAKFLLHEAAAQARCPTVSAYDLAYRQFVRVYDYRTGIAPFAGRLNDLRKARNPVAALTLLVPFQAVPYDLLSEIERLVSEPGASISQLGCTADLFGALVVPLAIELLAGRQVRESFVIDIKEAVLPARVVRARRWATLRGLLKLKSRLG